MPAKKECDEKLVVKQYVHNLPVKKIRAEHGISQNRVYGILRSFGIEMKRPRKQTDRGKKKAGNWCVCSRCKKEFQPYSVDYQYNTHLCRDCWEAAGTRRKAYPAEVCQWASI